MDFTTEDLYFNDLFENTSDLIHYVTLDGEIERVNPAWLNTLGYTFEEVTGRSIYDFVIREEVSAFKAFRKACINNHIQEEVQVSLLKKDGSPVILEGHLRPFFVGGTFRHTRGVFRNITTKKKKENEQREELSKITQFLTNAPDAVIIIDESQSVIEWNLKASEIFGYTKNEVLKAPLAELIIPVQYRQAHHTGMSHFLKTGHGPVLNRTIEVPAIDKNLREFPISLSISAVEICDEWFFIAFVSDISDKKQNEQTMIQKELELERSRQDDHRNKEFLSIASHELKTPLTSLKAYLQLALKNFNRQSQEQTGTFLNKAEEFTNKLDKLILNLLDISKIHAGKLILNTEPVEFSNMLRDIVETSQLLYPSHRLHLTSSEKVVINIDQERIEQVFVNLINNAVKYSPDANQVDLILQINKGHLLVEVKDFGSGIDVSNRDKVFDKFYRIEDLSKNHTQGLGIGLFISAQIIKQHNGTIRVENNENGGASFAIILPLQEPEEAEALSR